MPELICKVHNGKPDYREDIFDLSKLDGKTVLLSVEEFDHLKTNMQLRYFHGAICRAYFELGWTVDEVKMRFKEKLMEPKIITTKSGKQVACYPSLADFTKKQMSAFIEACQIIAGEDGVEIEPVEMYWKRRGYAE